LNRKMCEGSQNCSQIKGRS